MKNTKLKDEKILKQSINIDNFIEIKGYDFEGKFDFENFMKSYLTTGFQATEFYKGVLIIKEMLKTKTDIYLGFTSNMGTCGVRENIKFLCKNKFLKGISTTIGAVEEDIIKVFKPWVLGDWHSNGDKLREDGINKSGNIFCPNDRYIYFERFCQKLFERLLKIQKEENKIFSNYEIIFEMGRELENCLNDKKNNFNIDKKNIETSFVYWCYKNKIDIFCSAICDGSFGDMIYFFKKNNPEFLIDETNYILRLTDNYLNAKKVGVIAIGGSVPKHMLCNAGIFRDGIDYSIFINNNTDYDGSNCATNINEAKSWGKIAKESKNVKIESEASLIFPLLVLQGFFSNI